MSLTGSICSIKNNTQVQFESSLERDYMHLLEYDSNVLKYYEQPITINYYKGSSIKKYTPDFYVEYINKTKELIEIKYLEDLENNKDEYSHKFSAIKEFCKKNSMKFKVLDESKIRTPLLYNAKFLLYYRRVNTKINDNLFNLLFERITILKKSTPKQLVESLTEDKMQKAHLIYTLWYMVSKNFIDYDKKRKLTMDSIIWID